MHLSKGQINRILDFLEQEVKISLQCKDELLDHICSEIELELMTGNSFESALQKFHTTAKIEEFRQLDKQLRQINSKQKRIHFSLIALFVLVLFTLIYFHIWNEENTIETVQIPTQTSVLMQDSHTPSLWPVKNTFTVSSEFGLRMHPIKKKTAFHFGIDIPALHGEPVQATADGKVIKVGYERKGYGTYIILEHKDNIRSFYSQLSKVEISTGELVKKGQQIGKVGSSGQSTNPHLHFEIIKNGKKVDPLKYIRA